MPSHQNVFKLAEKSGFGEIHFKMDHDTQLFAIIAIHNTERGPAIGGCRWISYSHINDAIIDGLRLARGMTYKAAVSHLPHGGGKGVIIRPQNLTTIDREKYFASYAKFVDKLGGSYITAVDSGTTAEEMDIIARYTKHVTSTSAIGNPSVFTARGVLRGIEAAVKFKLKKDTLKDIHISIQGLGQVGYLLAQECHQRGAKLTVADKQTHLTERCKKEFQAEVVPSEIIHTIKADVFSPCALGAILNHHSISKIHSPIIAGAANNQLGDAHDGHLLHRLGILYTPDYVINAGGLIHASGKYHNATDQQIEKKVDTIYDTLMTIFDRSQTQNKATSDVADALALEIMEKPSTPW
jgi:leucine dehydrogenase